MAILALAALLGVPAQDTPTVRVVSVRTDPARAQAGETVRVTFDLEIPKGWHIYPVTTDIGRPTAFSFNGAEVSGQIQEEPAPRIHEDLVLRKKIPYHEGRVTFTVPLVLRKGPALGPQEVTGRIDMLVCQFEGQCVPSKVAVSFQITLLGGEVLSMLGLAFLGGMILNIMPCVLPVLTLKLYSLVQQRDRTAGERRVAALCYAAGVLGCLNALALVVVQLRSMGQWVGWGFQFQNPAFVVALTTLLFVFALSLLGVFDVPVFGAAAVDRAGRRKDAIGHLAAGFFLTLVATPCSAPLLGPAMGYAFTLSTPMVFLFFSTTAVGLAFPFLLVGFVPWMIHLFPRPGPWMDVFKKTMGFVLLGTVVWMMNRWVALTGPKELIGLLAFLTFVSAGAWIFGRWGGELMPARQRILAGGAAGLLAVAGGGVFLGKSAPSTEPPFLDAVVEGLRGKKPIFIDFWSEG